MSKSRKLEIDFETADKITVLNLQDYRRYLKRELRDYHRGEYLHPDDVIINMSVIQAIGIVLKQYGVD
jgi:hypothetical protein